MIVRTVLGDIEPSELGACDAHEHLFLATPAQPGDDFTDVDKAIAEARTLVDASGRALVDWTPLGVGRDLDGLAAVARATGLHIVAATGLHRDVHYAADSPYRSEPVDALADLFVADLHARCGMVKAGAGYHRLTPFEENVLAAAAAAHTATGAPVCIHTEHGTMGLAIVERLRRARRRAGLGRSGAPRPEPGRGRARRDGRGRCVAPARRPRTHQVLAGLDDPAPDRGSRRARARVATARRR